MTRRAAGRRGGVNRPTEFVVAQSATTGLPHALCRQNMAKIESAMLNMAAILDGLTGGLDLDVLDAGYGLPRRPRGELCPQGPAVRRGAAGQFAGRACPVAAGLRLEDAAGPEARAARAVDAAADHRIAPRGRIPGGGVWVLSLGARRGRRHPAEVRRGDDVRLGRHRCGPGWATRGSRSTAPVTARCCSGPTRPMPGAITSI